MIYLHPVTRVYSEALRLNPRSRMVDAGILMNGPSQNGGLKADSLLEDRTENRNPRPKRIALDLRTEGWDLRAHGE